MKKNEAERIRERICYFSGAIIGLKREYQIRLRKVEWIGEITVDWSKQRGTRRAEWSEQILKERN